LVCAYVVAVGTLAILAATGPSYDDELKDIRRMTIKREYIRLDVIYGQIAIFGIVVMLT